MYMKLFPDYLYEKCVWREEKNLTMPQRNVESLLFQSFYFARNVSDTTLHQSIQATRSVLQCEVLFSGWQNLYQYKFERPILPFWLAAKCIAQYPGSFADVEVLKKKSSLQRSIKNTVPDLDYSASSVPLLYSSEY